MDHSSFILAGILVKSVAAAFLLFSGAAMTALLLIGQTKVLEFVANQKMTTKVWASAGYWAGAFALMTYEFISVSAQMAA